MCTNHGTTPMKKQTAIRRVFTQADNNRIRKGGLCLASNAVAGRSSSTGLWLIWKAFRTNG
jgi:hypothetical protein